MNTIIGQLYREFRTCSYRIAETHYTKEQPQ